MNNVILAGRLTRDADIDFVGDSQVARARFTLAVDRDYKDKYGNRGTDFINIEAWGNRAQAFAPRLKKGAFTLIQGSVVVDRYKTADDESRVITKIYVNSFKYIETRDKINDIKEESKQYDGSKLFENVGVDINSIEEELPF
ncbi:single-stranded DNA-binding protein [Clostridium sp. CCUG 7971]|uniref:single-stranded DNA-binding protein n=1 Tax=Clostridium sp. CCUG 7971 TaxID=2811414 RepID=UPI001ABBB336|nr:single-stranded DNA-binding protein [Clostridium sp. CCUG 7971]MBO3443580.1 single-stranded DNA-binding protein [Clostridium sp. CCUG 7971]